MRELLSNLVLITGLGLSLAGCSAVKAVNVKCQSYSVKKGDTIFALSRRFGISAAKITELNDLSAPEELQIGQILKIPVSVSSSPRPSKKNGADMRNAGEDMNSVPRDEGSIKMVRLSSAKKYIGSVVWPVPDGRIISRFGRRWFKFHEGLDIAADEGLPIYAAHAGKVVYSDDAISGYGNLIVIKSDGIMTVYGHNEKNLVRRGQEVKKGEKIALVGQTGHAYGPHVHFEVRVKDSDGLNAAVDPLVFFRPSLFAKKDGHSKKG